MTEQKARETVAKASSIKVKNATIGDVQEYSEAKGFLAGLDIGRDEGLAVKIQKYEEAIAAADRMADTLSLLETCSCGDDACEQNKLPNLIQAYKAAREKLGEVTP